MLIIVSLFPGDIVSRIEKTVRVRVMSCEYGKGTGEKQKICMIRERNKGGKELGRRSIRTTLN